MMKLLEKVHLVSLFICSFLLLSSTVLIWGCSTLKQKLTKKGRSTTILSNQERVHEQSLLKEFKERELIKYFGAYATVLLKDGFRFSADSGLVGNSALISFQGHSLYLEKQHDSSSMENLSESIIVDDAHLTSSDSEKTEVRKGSPFSSLWWLVLLPVGWFVYRFWRWWG